jgi:hypothetical protein
MENENNFWQAEVLGQIYETSFAEIAQWIADGALMPTDKVRRGNLRWLEAGKIPPLMPFFNAKAQGIEPPQVQTNVTDASLPPNENTAPAENFQPVSEQTKPENYFHNQQTFHQPAQFSEPDFPTDRPVEDICALHPESEAIFHCETCANAFCPLCVKSYGGTVKICPMCGAMCKKIGERDVKKEREIKYHLAIGEGFGATDIGKAFAHPFKYKTSFVIGGVMFMFFTLGQSAGAIGGIMMLFAALVCFLLTNMLGFGILANTIENFSQGKLEADFMPNFEDFNLWDDVVHPFFLAIGVYISSFGALILVLIIGTYLLISSMQEQMQKMQNEKIQTESPFLIDEKKALNQSDEVKKLVAGIKEKADEKRDLTENGLNDEDFVSPAKTEEEEFEEINQMIQQQRKQELESVVGKTEETKQQEFKQMVSGFLSQGIVLLLLTIAAFFWGIFYFPAACAVAGYTRSFFATINPSVGIDTIKTFGADYFKILGVYILLLIAAVFVGILFNLIFLPFALPGMGNLPAIAVSSWFTFYFTIVFSCVLGFALFKNSDKFKFYRG